MFGFPIPIVNWIVTFGIGFIILSMFVRAIASWFGLDERNALIRFLARVTDPFIVPIRRILPRQGRFDFAFIIAFFMLYIFILLLQQAIPSSW
ncbi:MAG TPA: YggT family protein [Ktedonobacteraceae bacterium]|nr:YggT family protein [Ktedonobacteraceae bacterium]